MTELQLFDKTKH